jgi:hypothetical protein
MAKPIRSTPKLSGGDASNFIRKMISLEKTPINDKDKEFVEQIKKNSIFFKVY